MQKASTPIENRLGSVKEIAGIVAMLAGRDGAWITGQAISASGVSFIRFLRSCLSLSPPPHSLCVCVCVCVYFFSYVYYLAEMGMILDIMFFVLSRLTRY